MIHGVHHISLSTSNMDRLLAFYCNLLGLELIADTWIEPGFAPFERVVGGKNVRVRAVALKAGNLDFEIFAYAEPAPRPMEIRDPWDVGIRHFAFDVTDIDAEYARLKAAGVRSISEPQTIGNYGMRSVYMRDPDQNIVELQEILTHPSE